ncbi:MAG: type II secretion system protein GspF [Halobacteriovoraceae bacterium]|nr:type II secretion system protein GspF [Halobacteriovoraceae bacterium]|tara:strand:+ start:1328 stop:2536 length:1209 start_codon:yes stop_codon:yes gene_type:complete
MPLYQYKGLTKAGKEVKAEINADSIISAKSKIKTNGVMLLSIKEKKTKEKKSGVSFGGNKVKIQDLSIMTRQLATLVQARFQVVEALASLEEQVESDYLRVVLSEIKRDVNEGASLANALKKHPKVFNNVYVNMVDAGEESGTLDIVLMRLAEFTEAQLELKNKVSGAMIYPIIMIVVGFTLVSFIFVFVIPKLTKVFERSKMELPAITKICISISDFMLNYWWSIPIMVFCFFYLFNRWKSSPKGERTWHSVVLKLPIFGNLVQMINVSRFCSALGTLLNSGVPILVSLRIVKNLIPNVHIKESIELATVAVKEGASMAPALKTSGHFPIMVTHMIALGEKTGELEEMLNTASNNYENQVNSKLNGLTSIIEPIMIVFLGLMVLVIVMAVVLPMMKLNQLN